MTSVRRWRPSGRDEERAGERRDNKKRERQSESGAEADVQVGKGETERHIKSGEDFSSTFLLFNDEEITFCIL